MDFNQVRYFLALGDSLNFTRAAEQCAVSQPALTQAIRRLESELGGELIIRAGRDTELTELGRSLRGHFEQIERTKNLVRSTANAVVSGEVAELNLGIMCTVGPRIVARMLDRFQTKQPQLSIVLHDVVPDKIPELLLSRALDAVFGARYGPSNSKVHSVPLFEEKMVVAFPPGHELGKYKEVPLSALANERYVERLHCESRADFLKYCHEREVELNIVFRCEREDWIQSLIREGVGVCVLPEHSLLGPELDFRPVLDLSLTRQVELSVASTDDLPRPLMRLIDFAQDHDWPAPLL